MKNLSWEEAKKVINQGSVFLSFKTTWCPDCKMMEPVIEQVEKEVKKQKMDINFINVDAEEANLYHSSEAWQVLKVPSFFFIHQGKRFHIGYEYLPAKIIIEAINDKYY